MRDGFVQPAEGEERITAISCPKEEMEPDCSQTCTEKGQGETDLRIGTGKLRTTATDSNSLWERGSPEQAGQMVRSHPRAPSVSDGSEQPDLALNLALPCMRVV